MTLGEQFAWKQAAEALKDAERELLRRLNGAAKACHEQAKTAGDSVLAAAWHTRAMAYEEVITWVNELAQKDKHD